ncbi:AcrR family transcriptional regulator [Mycobacterium sp. MAA66]|uniref:TetR/AcrR family transcriptional regulator n=1 Tax=Mycobacterium sp. MAA66 TaxID=3156297 RepID=UPI0035142D90
MPPSNATYHHGDLRTALISSALALLEDGGAEALSIRAVARHAGVTAAAPYRHYADRDALLSAVAAVGYQDLAEVLVDANPEPSTPEELADVAVAYVQFALRRPALFRVMFSEPCDPTTPERAHATTVITAYVNDIVARAFPDSDTESLSDAIWALVHGLAFLYLDGKFDNADPQVTDARVRAAIHAVANLRN